MFTDTFEAWYKVRMKHINKGGMIDTLLTFPIVREYLYEAYKQGYIDCYTLKGDNGRFQQVVEEQVISKVTQGAKSNANKAKG